MTDSRSRETKLTPGLAVFILAVAVTAVYLPAVGFEFVGLDDEYNITRNAHLVSRAGLAELWSQPYLGLYVPLTYTVWALLRRLSEGPALFHAFNILVHLLNAGLVFALVSRVLARLQPSVDRGRIRAAALCGALLFACHPVQQEAVAWATGLKDLLSTALALGALLLAFETTRGLRLAGASALFVASCLAKPGMVALALALAALELEPAADGATGFVIARAKAWLALLWAAVGAAVSWVTVASQVEVVGRIPQPLWFRPFEALANLATDVGALATLRGLSVATARPIAEIGHTAAFWGLAAAGAAIVCGAYALRRRWPPVIAVLGLILAGFLPVSGLMPFQYQSFADTADRFLYFPMCGVALGAAAAYLALSPAFPRAAALVVLALVCGLGAVAAARLPLWRNEVVLAGESARLNPTRPWALAGYAAALAKAGRIDEGVAYYRRVYELDPRAPGSWWNLQSILAFAGRVDELRDLYAKVLAREPADKDALFGQGNLLALTGQARRGAAALDRAFTLDARLREGSYYPGEALIAGHLPVLGDPVRSLAEARKLVPSALSLERMATVLEAKKRWPDIIVQPELDVVGPLPLPTPSSSPSR